MEKPHSDHRYVTRRTALVSAAGATLGVAALGACGGNDSAGVGDGYGGPAPSKAGSSGPASASPTTGSDSGGRELVRLADVPVGGAVSAEDAAGKPVIVAQPEAGQVVAFSAICTHKGCTVAPEDGILKCPCHGSTYDQATGDNTGGPAPEPLPEIAVSVKDGSVVQS